MHRATRIFAIILVLLAFLLAVLALSLHRRPPPAAAPSAISTANKPQAPIQVPMVLARRALPAGRTIEPSDLVVQLRPAGTAGTYTSIESLGQAVPLVDIPAGTPLRSALMVTGISLALNPGERAVAVPVDDLNSAGAHVVAGTYVDVFASYKPASGNRGSAVTTPTQDATWSRLLLAHVRVLAFGQHELPSLAPAPAASAEHPQGRAGWLGGNGTSVSAGRSASEPPARNAVLAIPLDQVNELLLAAQNGKIVLALRNPTDSGLPDPQLFPVPAAALAPRPGLPADQRQSLASPENRAFAGTDLRGVSGNATELPRPSRGHPASSAVIEVIRGDLASSHPSAR
ncbi:Flp pilus assembly protein CpaB [Frateuria aurantia]